MKKSRHFKKVQRSYRDKVFKILDHKKFSAIHKMNLSIAAMKRYYNVKKKLERRKLTTLVKKRIRSLLPLCCNHCKMKSELLGFFDLDHINGNPLDNSFKNFQLLCPNCHRIKTIETEHKGNAKKKRKQVK